MYGEELEDSLDKVKSKSKFHEPDYYLPLNNFDKSDESINKLLNLNSLDLVGWLNTRPIFEVENDSYISEVSSWLKNDAKSFGLTAGFYKDGKLVGMIIVEDWQSGCIPRKYEYGGEMDYIESQEKDIFSTASKLNLRVDIKDGADMMYGRTKYFAHK